MKADKAGEPFRENDLYIKETYVDEGVTLKRFRARAQGRAARINKRTSHITVVVANKEGAAKDGSEDQSVWLPSGHH